jgi:hypothetical protein
LFFKKKNTKGVAAGKSIWGWPHTTPDHLWSGAQTPSKATTPSVIFYFIFLKLKKKKKKSN